MDLPPFSMANKRLAYFIGSAFLLGAVLLIFVLYNSAKNTNKLITGNAELLRELRLSDHLRVVDRDILSSESRIRAAMATNDTSHLQGLEYKLTIVNTYLDSLAKTNNDPSISPFINRLRALTREKLKIKDQLTGRFLAVKNMNDTSLIANPRARRISDETAAAISKIYDSRERLMIQLSASIREDIHIARVYRDVLIALLLLGGAIICLFIVSQFYQQNRLILQLDSSEKNAQEAAKVKEHFLANMSHEIRTPLTAILGFTNLLRRRKLDAESITFVGSIQNAGENLLAIINDILDLSKIEAGMMRIIQAPFSVSGLLHSVETMFSGRIKDKGLIFHSHIDPEVPDTLIGDATRLTQVLVNLIGNALKFSVNGNIRVAIYKKAVIDDVIHLGFRVTDDGIGIDKTKLAAVFERFNQAEDSITRNYGGTGLGLSIVKDLIVLQGGEIGVESEPGRGTEFHFFIPYPIAKEQITAAPGHSTEHYSGKINPSVNILVVDDNAMNQSLMKHLLTQWNAVFDVSVNGQEALGLLKIKKYDIVLMDIQMPVMDGYTATQFIRTELNLDVPIIAMTAHAMAGEREKCLSSGMNEYISKPLNEHDLFRMIKRFTAPGSAKEIASNEAFGIPPFRFIDLNYMKYISKGTKSYEKTVTAQFIQCLPADLANIKAAVADGDTISLRNTAHNLKTSVAIMGLLSRLEHILSVMESASADDGRIPVLVAELESICSGALKEAEIYHSTLG
jgi:signal transduction histidine kinase/CheY-like chemotaxis protein